MRRLSPRAVSELARAYLNDSSETDLTARDVFPASSCDEVFSLVQDQEGDKGDAFLVNWCIDDDNEEQRASSSRVAPMIEEDEEEDDVLGPVCQWRSCSCAARSSRRVVGKKQPNRPLCAWHRSLKRHLDDGAQAAGRASDALRFVPRAKAAREAAEAVRASKKSNYGDQDAAEAAAIRGASPLLVELANGKLGQTVRVFCRRAAAESAERKSRRKDKEDKGEGWARWDDARALSAARRDVAASLDRLDRVCAAERAATGELAARRAAGQFPADALVQIKREHARLDQERLEGDQDQAADERLELEFARRKVALLKADTGAQRPQVSVAAAADILAATAGRGDRSPDELMASPILEEPTDTGYGAPRRRAMASTARRAAAKLRFVSPYSSANNQAPKRRSSGRKF
jgi:hypothetical protein